FTYYPGMTRIPEGSAPSILNKSFKIGAELTIPAAGAEGVLVKQGGRFNGWGLYVLAGKAVFHYNTVGVFRYTVAGPDPLSPGDHTIVLDFTYDGGGLGKPGRARRSGSGSMGRMPSSRKACSAGPRSRGARSAVEN